MSDLAKAIGTNIAAERQRQNLSQHALGRRAGVPGQSISAWELGQREIGAAKLVAVAHALHVSVAWLLGEPHSPEDIGYQAGWDDCAKRVAAACQRPLLPKEGE